MKLALIITTMIMTTSFLSACAADGPSSNSSGYTMGTLRPPTGRVPSPRNIQGSALNESSRMIAPTR